jgi:hypothetical protein
MRVSLSPVNCTPSRNIHMQRISELSCELRLSAAVGQEPDVGLA